MSRIFKSVARIALPVLGTAVAPGVGTALGSALSAGTLSAIGGALGGAASGAMDGGGLKGALTGAALGGIGGAAPQITGALGVTGAAGSGLTNAIRGGALGGIAGGSEGALTGALLGGAGGYISAGGTVPGLGNVAGAPLEEVTGVLGAQGPTQGSGLLGELTSGTGVFSGGGGSSLGGTGMGLGDLLKGGASLYSMGAQEETNEEIRRQLLAAQGQAQAQLSPFQQTGVQANQQLSQSLAGGFQPTDLANDPAYQFRLQQGEQALQRQAAAAGLTQSGAALQAAQDYGQGLASTEYDNAYNRWIQRNQQLGGLSAQGLQAADGIASTALDAGSAQAILAAQQREAEDRALSQLLSGNLTRSIYG